MNSPAFGPILARTSDQETPKPSLNEVIASGREIDPPSTVSLLETAAEIGRSFRTLAQVPKLALEGHGNTISDPPVDSRLFSDTKLVFAG